MTAALGFPGAPAAFERMCEILMRDAPWATTLSDAVDWRRARRHARITGVDPSGALQLRASHPAIALEDAEGTLIPLVAQ